MVKHKLGPEAVYGIGGEPAAWFRSCNFAVFLRIFSISLLSESKEGHKAREKKYVDGTMSQERKETCAQ